MKTTDNGTQTTGTERTACTCKCGGYTRSTKARYIPGHDAKHVSRLLAEFKELVGEADEVPAAAQLLRSLTDQLGTDALQVKLDEAIQRWMHKEFDRWAAKVEKDDSATCAFGFHPDDFDAYMMRQG